MEKQVVQFQFGGQDVTLETGAVARQATGAVMITMGETQILATVVGSKNLKPGQSFFPLSVHYQEKTYAAGKIPGGYFKREGRPTEKETLTSRLIRPFGDGCLCPAGGARVLGHKSSDYGCFCDGGTLGGEGHQSTCCAEPGNYFPTCC